MTAVHDYIECTTERRITPPGHPEATVINARRVTITRREPLHATTYWSSQIAPHDTTHLCEPGGRPPSPSPAVPPAKKPERREAGPAIAAGTDGRRAAREGARAGSPGAGRARDPTRQPQKSSSSSELMLSTSHSSSSRCTTSRNGTGFSESMSTSGGSAAGCGGTSAGNGLLLGVDSLLSAR